MSFLTRRAPYWGKNVFLHECFAWIGISCLLLLLIIHVYAIIRDIKSNNMIERPKYSSRSSNHEFYAFWLLHSLPFINIICGAVCVALSIVAMDVQKKKSLTKLYFSQNY